MDITGPVVQAVGPVAPDPRNTAVAQVLVRFNEPIDLLSFSYADLELRRDGQPVPLSPAVTVAPFADTTYLVQGLDAFTGAEGSYELTVLASGINDVLGNAGSGSGSDTWRVDRTGPAVLRVGPVTPDPRNTPVASVEVEFSEPLAPGSFGLEDLSLTLDGTPIDLSSGAAITPLSDSLFRIDGLAALTGDEGAYMLTVLAGGVTDVLGNAGVGSGVDIWQTDTTAPQVTAVGPVAPDPRNSAVSVLNVSFSEPLAAGSFDWQDLLLTRDGQPVPLSAAVSVVPLSPAQYRLEGLSSFTDAEGHYELTVFASGVSDPAGNAGIGQLADAWTIDLTAPQALDVTDVTPDPRSTPVSTIDVSFSEPIDPATFGLEDLTLRRNGVVVPLSGLTISHVTGGTYRIDGLAPFTAAEGSYEFSFSGTGVQDLAGNIGSGTASDTWQVDLTGPQVLAVGPVVPDPRNEPVASIAVLFSEPVELASFDWQDLSLTRDGQPVPLDDSVAIEPLGGASYAVHGLVPFTSAEGEYQFSVDASGVRDLLGNFGTGQGQTTWTMDLTPPSIVDVVDVEPDPRSLPVSSIELRLSEWIDLSTFDWQDLSLKRDGQPVPLDARISIQQLAAPEPTYRILGLADFTAADGQYELTIDASQFADLAGNAGTGVGSDAWRMDTTPPRASIEPPNGSVLNRAVRFIDVTFSEPMDPDAIADPANYSLVGQRVGQVPITVSVQEPQRAVRIRRRNGRALADDNYTLTLSAAGLIDEVGLHLDGNGDGVGGDNLVSRFQVERWPGPPRVEEVRLRQGGPVTKVIQVKFSEPMRASEAGNARFYRLTAAGRDGRFGTADDVQITDFTVQYRPRQRMAILRSRRGFVNDQLHYLVIDAAISARQWRDPKDRHLDGNEDGVGGDDFTALIGRGKRLTFRDFDGDIGRLILAGPGKIELVQNLGAKRLEVRLQGTRPDSRLRGRRLRGGNGDRMVQIQYFAVDPGRKFRSRLRRPPFEIGPLPADLIDALIEASQGTMRTVDEGGVLLRR